MKAIFANSLDYMTRGLAVDDFKEEQHTRGGDPKNPGRFSKGSGGGAAKGGESEKAEAKPAEGKAEAKPAAEVEISPEIHEFIKGYDEVFPSNMQRFRDITADLGYAEGRVKKAESLAKKMKKKKRELTTIGDIMGMRCTSKTPADVYKALEVVRSRFKVLNNAAGEPDIEDVMQQGKGYYRAVHVTVDSLDETGTKRAEVQLRTERQSQIAYWGHDTAYKGKFADDPEVQAYAKKVSDVSWELDNGRHAEWPEAPAVLKQHGLEYQPDKKYYDEWLCKERPEFL